MDYKNAIYFTGFCLLVLFLVLGTGIRQFQKEAWARRIEDKSISFTEPRKESQGARESFLTKDVKISAEEIRKGFDYLETMETKAEKSREKAYQQSFHNMREVTDRVENGTVATVTEFDQEFAAPIMR
jgi:hypothetical protein